MVPSRKQVLKSSFRRILRTWPDTTPFHFTIHFFISFHNCFFFRHQFGATKLNVVFGTAAVLSLCQVLSYLVYIAWQIRRTALRTRLETKIGRIFCRWTSPPLKRDPPSMLHYEINFHIRSTCLLLEKNFSHKVHLFIAWKKFQLVRIMPQALNLVD